MWIYCEDGTLLNAEQLTCIYAIVKDNKHLVRARGHGFVAVVSEVENGEIARTVVKLIASRVDVNATLDISILIEQAREVVKAQKETNK